MEEQIILTADAQYSELTAYIKANQLNKILLVCDSSLEYLDINKYFKNIEDETGASVVFFSDFIPNPTYESVVSGVNHFHRAGCDSIIAVGGGSAIDIAKCIKLYSNMNPNGNYLNQVIIPNEVKLLAIPTTAGTGSEATRFAVIYYNGKKQSVTDCSCIPSAVLMDASVLKTLPIYQKKSTMMDALCHAIESFWSVNSTEESKEYSREAIKMILSNMEGYLANDVTYNAAMLRASNLAGKAINITQTTAGHAMCYKLTGLYGIAHGHAAALCVKELWPYMIKNMDNCIDSRGEFHLAHVFSELSAVMKCSNAIEASEKFRSIINRLELTIPKCDEGDIDILKTSVNPVRLRNNPVKLTIEAIEMMYRQILGEGA